MINERNAKKFCCEDIRNIQNYELAVADKNNKWHVHHRLELSDDGQVVHREDLIERKLYYGRPASELIFLEEHNHHSLHAKSITDDVRKKRRNRLLGIGLFEGHHHTEEAKRRIGAAAKLRCGLKSSRIRRDIWEQRKKVLSLLNDGLSQRQVAKLLGCSRTVISNIIKT